MDGPAKRGEQGLRCEEFATAASRALRREPSSRQAPRRVRQGRQRRSRQVGRGTADGRVRAGESLPGSRGPRQGVPQTISADGEPISSRTPGTASRQHARSSLRRLPRSRRRADRAARYSRRPRAVPWPARCRRPGSCQPARCRRPSARRARAWTVRAGEARSARAAARRATPLRIVTTPSAPIAGNSCLATAAPASVTSVRQGPAGQREAGSARHPWSRWSVRSGAAPRGRGVQRPRFGRCSAGRRSRRRGRR